MRTRAFRRYQQALHVRRRVKEHVALRRGGCLPIDQQLLARFKEQPKHWWRPTPRRCPGTKGKDKLTVQELRAAIDD